MAANLHNCSCEIIIALDANHLKYYCTNILILYVLEITRSLESHEKGHGILLAPPEYNLFVSLSHKTYY